MRLRILVLLILSVQFSWTQQLNFKNYGVSDGLAQSQVFDIVESAKGELYIATQGGGVSIFDGRKFRTINEQQNLLSNYVNSVSAIGDSIFIGTEKGLSIIYDGVVSQNYAFGKAITNVEKVDSEIYVFTKGGSFTLKNEEIIPLQNAQLKNKHSLGIIEIENKKWIITINGVFSLENSFTSLTSANGLPNSNVVSYCNTENGVLLGTYGKGIISVSKKFTEAKQDIITDNIIISTIFEDHNGNLWIGSQTNGLYRMVAENGVLENFTDKSGLSNNNVQTIYEDSWGDIWIGTSGGGLSKFAGSQFVHYDTYSGLNGDYVFSVLNSAKSGLWIGTSGGGIVNIGDTLTKSYDKNIGFTNGKIKNICEGRKGEIWTSIEGEGLGVILPELDTAFILPSSSRLRSNWVLDIAVAKGGSIWLATADRGLLQMKVKYDSLPRASVYGIPQINKDLSSRVEVVAIDNENQLWFYDKNNGLGCFKGKEVNFIRNGQKNIREIAFYKDKIIVGTNQGLFVVNEGNLEEYQFNSQLTSKNIYQINVTENEIWLGTESGLDRISNPFSSSVELKHYGYNEGFRGVETSLRACFKDFQNQLWFGTVDGLSKFEPRPFKLREIAPKLELSEILLSYTPFLQTTFGQKDSNKRYNLIDTIILPYNKTQLEFDLSAIDLSTNSDIKYSWKLDGFTEQWSPESSRSEIIFTQIPPGKYTLWYKAGNERTWTEPRSIYLEITPPYWQTWWFITLCIVGGLLIVGGIIGAVIFRLRTKNKKLKEKLAVERNLVELEQKALRLQMNPHFIFNVLQSIQEKIITDNKEEARLAIAKFAKLMREILENSRESLITIEEECDTLENYIKLEQITKSIEFDYTLFIADDVPEDEPLIPPLMIQPFIENALIHGLKNITHKGHIKVSIEMQTENLIRITIEDNGCGRLQAQNQKAQVDHLHKSLALQVTQERLANLNKNKEDIKLFEIIDLMKGEKAVGTRVVLRVPVG